MTYQQIDQLIEDCWDEVIETDSSEMLENVKMKLRTLNNEIVSYKQGTELVRLTRYIIDKTVLIDL